MEISGKIIDINGETLPMANVSIITGSQANKFGTSTDNDGNFSLSSDIITPDSQFKISYIGFEPKVLKASDLQSKTITLTEGIEALKEVTIFGKPKPKPKVIASNLKQHIKKNGLIYAGLGGFAGIALIISSIKK
jgi:hypothetical protein